jgi:hypothetical protein
VRGRVVLGVLTQGSSGGPAAAGRGRAQPEN